MFPYFYQKRYASKNEHLKTCTQRYQYDIAQDPLRLNVK